jgi:8-amino-7-oxononanoate synthase
MRYGAALGNAAKVLAGRTVTGAVSARITVDGREYINFFGAGYLALNCVPEIREAVQRALAEGVPFGRQLPWAHGAVDPVFDAVEGAGALACGNEASVYFASGYMIGAVALAGCEQPFDVFLLDEHAHYSLRDAVSIHGRAIFSFAHCDADSLRSTLRQHVRGGQRPLIVTDGAFATTGRVPPLHDYAAEVAARDGRLLIDESHSFGVVGPNGRGAAELCGVEHLSLSGATLSKALCAHGALMGCSHAVAQRVRTLPPLAAACSGSPLSATAAAASLSYVSRHPELRTQLSALTGHLRARLRALGLDVIDSPAPIVSFRYGDREQMRALQRRAFERGFYLHHSTYLGAGADGLIRCAVFRDHSHADIDALIALLGES